MFEGVYLFKVVYYSNFSQAASQKNNWMSKRVQNEAIRLKSSIFLSIPHILAEFFCLVPHEFVCIGNVLFPFFRLSACILFLCLLMLRSQYLIVLGSSGFSFSCELVVLKYFRQFCLLMKIQNDHSIAFVSSPLHMMSKQHHFFYKSYKSLKITNRKSA